ncbi:MAG: restriction endonuclease subunit S [Candidatus Atribacteria bacterium]|nr:restriction endonuclease subunit S [Candidatus Atribacteria bacterium]
MINKGWTNMSFGEIISFLTDYQANGSFAALKENVRTYKEANYAVLVRLKDLRENLENSRNFIYTDEHGYNFLKKSFLESDDILVANVGAGVGTTLLMPKFNQRATLAPNMFKVILCQAIVKKYFLYFSNSLNFWQQLKLVSAGSGQPKINKDQYKSIHFPLAPLPEQRAIVSKIEQLFSELDNGIANLKAAKEKLVIYRQAVLKKAFEGELTKKWRKLNDSEMIWNNVEFKELVTSSRNGFTGRPNEDGIGIPRLGITAVTQSNSILANVNDYKYIEIPKEKEDTYRLKEGDIVVCRQNGTLDYVGKFALVKDPIDRLIFSDSLIRIRINENELLPRYAVYFFNSFGRKEIEKKCATTAGNYSINSTSIKSIEIVYPTKEEQKQVIFEIESRLSVCDNILVNIDEGLVKSEALRQSILKQAFEGKLLKEEELEVCRKEADWEPAEELLERIKTKKKN